MKLYTGQTDHFVNRHNGSVAQEDIERMLKVIGVNSVDELISKTVPSGIRMQGDLKISDEVSEQKLLQDLKKTASKNQVFKNYIGMGYYNCYTPGVVLRNIMENPGWYTQYTPYQAEIAQGRLEALLNYQTMIIDLTGLPITNASLLDEGTAAAEAMAMFSAGEPWWLEAEAETSRAEDAERATRLRRYGIDLPRFRDALGEIDPACDIAEIGWAATLNNLCSAIGNVQLDSVTARVERGREVAAVLQERLASLPGIEVVPAGRGAICSHWALLVRALHRDAVLAGLKRRGVAASKLHHRTDTYSGFHTPPADLPQTQRFLNQVLGLPCGWWLSEDDIDAIVTAVADAMTEASTTRCGWPCQPGRDAAASQAW